jgi:peroxiredoxin
MEPTMTLAEELSTFKENFISRVDPARLATIEAHIARSRSDGVAASALGVGAMAPAFSLRNQSGRTVALHELTETGPVVVVFYRGGWCPYCNLQLRAYQRLLPELEAAGVRLVAISPQAPDASLSTAEKNALAFDVLSDVGSAVAQAFGIVYTLPPELQSLYAQVGHALPDVNGDDSWTLPVPATFVIGQDGRVLAAHVDVDYRGRLEPAEALRIARLARGAVPA